MKNRRVSIRRYFREFYFETNLLKFTFFYLLVICNYSIFIMKKKPYGLIFGRFG
jgi:hypothetical protein